MKLGHISKMFTYKARKVNLDNTTHQKVFNFPNSSSMIHGNQENLRFYYQLFIFLVSWCIFLPASSIQITELMYNPPNRENEETSSQSTMEFIELYNEKADYLDLGEWKFTKGIKFQFPEGVVIAPKTYFLVAKNPEKLRENYIKFYQQNITAQIFGPFQGLLSDKKDWLVLSDPAGGAMIDFAYEDKKPWPMAADGTGHTLSKIAPRLNDNKSTNWLPSQTFGGTPGRTNNLSLDSTTNFRHVLINEILIKDKKSKSSFFSVEIYNPTEIEIDLSGYWLSDSPNRLQKYQIPQATKIEPEGFFVITHQELKFKLARKTERLFLTHSSLEQVIDVASVPHILTNHYHNYGRYPDGSVEEWYLMPDSLSKANKIDDTDSLVINEIMYHPPDGSKKGEYIELYNCGTQTVDLFQWELTGGIEFRFKKNTKLAIGSYLVVAKDIDYFRSQHKTVDVIGNFRKTLSNNNGRVELRNEHGNLVDKVEYYDGGSWPKSADGYGSSLELINPGQDNSNSQVWQNSEESSKSDWHYISYLSICKEDRGEEAWPRLHLNLQGAGEILIDDVRLTKKNSPFFVEATRDREWVANGSFEYGVEDWEIIGTHIDSQTVVNQSKHGRKSLRLLASSSGNTGPNHVEIPLQFPLVAGDEYLISFWAKWQKGSNLLLTRCSGNQLSETHWIPRPNQPGTPGRQNSVYQSMIGPVFQKPIHSPITPTAKDHVQVEIQVYDPNGISEVHLNYKADRPNRSTDSGGLSTTSYRQITMLPIHQAKSGYILYRANIPNHSAPQTVAFYVQSTNEVGSTSTWPRDISRPGLYRIEHDEAKFKPELPSYRIIMRTEDVEEIENRPSLSNKMMNATFIFNETDVYYQVGCRWTGSPYRRGRSGYPSGYKIRFNADQKLHGLRSMARFDRNDNAPGGSYHERLSYYLLRKMGLPRGEQEWITVRFNSDQDRLVWGDIMPPNSQFLSIFYPRDDNDQLFEITSYFDFRGEPGDARNFRSQSANFEWYGDDDLDLYRWNYQPRSRESKGDFDALFELLKVMNYQTNSSDTEESTNLSYETSISKHINVEQWLRMLATRVVVSDWDFVGATSGQNAYVYRPGKSKKWELLTWDNEWGYDRVNMSVWADAPAIKRFQQSPTHQHLYFGFMRELIKKYFNVDYLLPRVQHYHRMVGGKSPDMLMDFVKDRTTYLDNLIPKAKAKVTQWNPGLFTLKGTAPVETKMIKVIFQNQKVVDYYPQWLSATDWHLALSEKTKPTSIQFFDNDHNLIVMEQLSE